MGIAAARGRLPGIFPFPNQRAHPRGPRRAVHGRDADRLPLLAGDEHLFLFRATESDGDERLGDDRDVAGDDLHG